MIPEGNLEFRNEGEAIEMVNIWVNIEDFLFCSLKQQQQQQQHCIGFLLML